MTILCIMDGFGLSDKVENNAIKLANTKTLDFIFDKYNMVHGNASGRFVGLPDGQMGNSEVGHLNIGAGRIVYQDLTKITKQIEEGVFFDNKILKEAFEHVKKNNSSIHFFGLLSDGGVHSHIGHLYALLKMAKMQNVSNVYIHCFMDGRDTDPKSGLSFIEQLNNQIKNIGVGKIATISGRYYAMDRDKNYDRIKKCYDVLVGEDLSSVQNELEYIKNSYEKNITDEFLLPISIGQNDDIKNTRIKNNDAIIFFNFRPDRARQITRSFVDDNFDFFDRKKIENLKFVCFTDYDENIKEKMVAFPKEDINNTLGQIISDNNLKQLRIAETEKYAHVTFFMNGGKEEPYKNEDRILIPSPKDVPTYDLKPEMSANEVCDNVIKAIESEKYDVIIINFANPDMVGHTGNIEATKKAIETIDICIKKIYEKIENTDNYLFICADHGNAEKMTDEKGNPWTAHTNNDVPFVLINNKGYKLKSNGSLCDIAPTLLELLNIKKPIEMTGNSLIM